MPSRRGRQPHKPRIITFGFLFVASSLWGVTQASEGADLAGTRPSLLSRYSLNAAHKRSRLPKYLREVSGLALDSNQQLILHHDNNARVWRFDTQSERLETNPLQDLPIKGDFEGIARFNESIVLSASVGLLKRLDTASQLSSGQSSRQTATLHPQDGWIELPFKHLCNFEGLTIVTHKDRSGTLLMPCKYPRFQEAGAAPADDNLIYIFRHSLNPDLSLSSKALQRLAINITPVLKAYRLPRLRPSAIEVTNGRLLILAGKERVLLEIDMQGTLIDWRRLRWLRHRQAEGLTVLADGTLIIADEGRWLGGTVTQYRPSSASASAQ